MTDKTKAAMPGRLSLNALLKHRQITRLAAGGQTLSQRNPYVQINRVRLTYGHRNPLKLFQTVNLQSAQNSLKLLSQLNYREMRELANTLIIPKNTNGAVRLPQIEVLEEINNLVPESHLVHGSSTIGGWGSEAFLYHEENQQHQVLDDENWLSLSESVNQPSLRGPVNGITGSNPVQPFGSMPLVMSSRRASSFSQLARLVPSRSASASSCAFSSGLMRIWKGGDLPAPRGWLSRTIISLSVDMCTPIDLSLISLGVHTNMCISKNTTPPNGITSTERGLTTTDSLRIEAAMKDHITHPQGRESYTWRFLALNRHDKKAKPCRLTVEASTECEARRILAPHFILSLAARLPVKEVSHA